MSCCLYNVIQCYVCNILYCVKCNYLLSTCESCENYICDNCLFNVNKYDVYYNELRDVPLCPKNICINNYIKCYNYNKLNIYENDLKLNKCNESLINLIENIKLDILKSSQL